MEPIAGSMGRAWPEAASKRHLATSRTAARRLRRAGPRTASGSIVWPMARGRWATHAIRACSRRSLAGTGLRAWAPPPCPGNASHGVAQHLAHRTKPARRSPLQRTSCWRFACSRHPESLEAARRLAKRTLAIRLCRRRLLESDDFFPEMDQGDASFAHQERAAVDDARRGADPHTQADQADDLVGRWKSHRQEGPDDGHQGSGHKDPERQVDERLRSHQILGPQPQARELAKTGVVTAT